MYCPSKTYFLKYTQIKNMGMGGILSEFKKFRKSEFKNHKRKFVSTIEKKIPDKTLAYDL